VLIDGFGRCEDPIALLRLPCLQYVKLHGSLTRKLATDEAAVAKLSTLVALALGHGIAPIAECVEDDEILARLQALKVRYAQGFGICVPQTIDLISELPAMRFGEHSATRPQLVPLQGLLDLTLNPGEARWAPA
jgi:EAL domain-containing protein (putative c-di-GMP-specific phosphodiesterase class I)